MENIMINGIKLNKYCPHIEDYPNYIVPNPSWEYFRKFFYKELNHIFYSDEFGDGDSNIKGDDIHKIINHLLPGNFVYTAGFHYPMLMPNFSGARPFIENFKTMIMDQEDFKLLFRTAYKDTDEVINYDLISDDTKYYLSDKNNSILILTNNSRETGKSIAVFLFEGHCLNI